MFSFLKSKKAPELEHSKVLAERAERGGTPKRIVDNFAQFAAPNQTVEMVALDEYVHLLKKSIEMLRHEIGMDHQHFEDLVMPMLRRFLSWVHLLPASANNHHARLGGLAIHALDVAALAARNAHNAVLDYDPVFTRDLELKAHRVRLWPLAAATAGLHHDLGKVLIDQVVTSAETGEVWNPFVCDLLTWGQERSVQRYAISWRGGDRLHRHESFALLLMGHIAGREVMGMLSSLGRDIMEGVLMSVSGEQDDPQGLKQMVHLADATSSRLDRDASTAFWSEGSSTKDPIVSRILDKAADLVRRRVWKVNTTGYPIWVNQNGAFLIWPMAFTQARDDLQAQHNATGIPIDHKEVAEIFLRAGIAKPRELSNGQKKQLWTLEFPPVEGTKSDEKAPFLRMMEAVNNTLDALYLPDPGPLVQGIVVSDAEKFWVARDPTLPAAAHPAVTVTEPSRSAQPDEPSAPSLSEMDKPPDSYEGKVDAEPASSPDVADVSAAAGAVAPQAELAARPNGREPGRESDPPAQQGPNSTEQTAAAGDGQSAYQQAIQTLQASGLLGQVLLTIADKIALEPETYPNSRDRLIKLSGALLLRWPEAVKTEVKDLRELSEDIQRHPEYLVRKFKGQTVDVASGGITISTAVRGGMWNVLPLNETLSKAFETLARRTKSPVSGEMP